MRKPLLFKELDKDFSIRISSWIHSWLNTSMAVIKSYEFSLGTQELISALKTPLSPLLWQYSSASSEVSRPSLSCPLPSNTDKSPPVPQPTSKMYNFFVGK